MPSIASQIRAKRLRLGLTQFDVSYKAGVSRPTVIAAEQGRPLNMAALQSILKVIELELDVRDFPLAHDKAARPVAEPALRGQRFPLIGQVMARAQRQGGYV